MNSTTKFIRTCIVNLSETKIDGALLHVCVFYLYLICRLTHQETINPLWHWKDLNQHLNWLEVSICPKFLPVWGQMEGSVGSWWRYCYTIYTYNGILYRNSINIHVVSTVPAYDNGDSFYGYRVEFVETISFYTNSYCDIIGTRWFTARCYHATSVWNVEYLAS